MSGLLSLFTGSMFCFSVQNSTVFAFLQKILLVYYVYLFFIHKQTPMEIVNAKELGTHIPAPSKFERISFILVLVLVFLLPIFFIPSAVVPFQLSKTVLLSVTVLVALFLWIIARLKDGVFTFQKNYVSLSLLSLPVVVLVASLFSGNERRESET